MNDGKAVQIREYLTLLLKRRSVIALCCGILTLMLSFFGIIAGVSKTVAVLHENGFTSFTYYTMASNTLAALSVAFVLPYTVEGIRKKRFTLPKWVAVIHYIATTSIAVMMVFVIFFISWASPVDAFGETNIVLHVFCPLLILISFFQMENGHLYSLKDRLFGIIPFGVYVVIYTIEVVVVGEANGGWHDIYHITEYISPILAIPFLLLLAFGTGTAIALASNFLTKKRHNKMYMLWHEDLDPIEVRIEAYGFGRMVGRYSEKNNIQIPYDILMNLAQMYHLETEDLIKPFFKGLLIELKERNNEENGLTDK